MSTDAHPARRSAVFHGHLNLEQQRKRAKELLKAARAGVPEALARFAAQLPSPSLPPKLADAQLVVARENGFGSWPRLKQHIEALSFAVGNMEHVGDRELHTLHIRCGSDIQHKLKTAGFIGDFLEFSDPFCIGPVPDLPLDDHLRSRARFLATAFNMTEADSAARLQREYRALDALDRYERVVLWFEHDSYDQLILAYLLKRFGEWRPKGRLELIAVDAVPGVERFIGIGQLAPEVLCWLWAQRAPITAEQLQLGAAAWAAITASAPQMLERLANAGTPALPLLAPALRRHLRELPDCRTGLGLTERLTLRIVAEKGPIGVGAAFGALQKQDPLPYLGDLMFWWLIQPLITASAPLLEIDSETPDQPWIQHRLRLTQTGQQVLDGEASWLQWAQQTRWVGGVAVPMNGGTWCFDERTEKTAWVFR